MKRLGTTAQRLAVLAMGLGFTFAVTAMAADAGRAKPWHARTTASSAMARIRTRMVRR